MLGMSGFTLSSPGIAAEEIPVNLEKLRQEPENYLGQRIVVEGILEAQGRGRATRFWLRAGEGGLAVTPWAPLEVYHPREGEARVKGMAHFVGRRLRLTGLLAQENGELILKVDSAQDL
jgi:hypothetical protein